MIPTDDDINEARRLSGSEQVPIAAIRAHGPNNTAIYSTLWHLSVKIAELRVAHSTIAEMQTEIREEPVAREPELIRQAIAKYQRDMGLNYEDAWADACGIEEILRPLYGKMH